MSQPVRRAVIGAAGVCLVLAVCPAEAPAQWTVAMRAMENPIPVGQCVAIEVVPMDATGAPPLRPDGRQLDWQDFDLEFTATVLEAFACLQPHERVPGVEVRQGLPLGASADVPAGDRPCGPAGTLLGNRAGRAARCYHHPALRDRDFRQLRAVGP